MGCQRRYFDGGHEGEGTVDVFVAHVFKAELDYLVSCCHDLALVDVAVVCIP